MKDIPRDLTIPIDYNPDINNIGDKAGFIRSNYSLSSSYNLTDQIKLDLPYPLSK